MDNPNIEWINKSGKECLKFTFSGKFRDTDAVIATKKWREIFATRKQDKITLIWDCQNMHDYDQQARTLWQNACKEMKDQISIIWVITNSILIRMGASVISVFTSLKIKVVASEQEIQI
ncbi:MAG: hypothetical protein ACYDBT_14115 [Desulfobulbaceae bacterium]